MMSIARSLVTICTMSGLSVNSFMAHGAVTANKVSRQVATITPMMAAFFVSLLHASISPEPICHPVMMAFAWASAEPTQ